MTPSPLTVGQALADCSLDPIEARALMRHLLDVNNAHLVTHSEQALTPVQTKAWPSLLARRTAGEPIAYMVGAREFYSLEFQVTPDVLIPRPETELLVDFALERIDRDAPADVLDLGTGSGCIAISIAHHRPLARIVAVDRSEPALSVARENAERLLEKSPSPFKGEGWDGGAKSAAREGLTPTLTLPLKRGGNLCFAASDWFAALVGRRFDLILANPPYVAECDAHLTRGDLRFEPQQALTAGPDGLDCIRRIIAAAPEFLMPKGWLALEHGQGQAAGCRGMLVSLGFDKVFSRCDAAGIERLSGGQRAREPALDLTRPGTT